MPHLGDTLAARRKAAEPSLLVYLMAGSVPNVRFLATVKELAEAGVTGLELGFPFSDPMAEGPVIQKASADALARGFRWKDLLELLPQVAALLPCAVMTYLNPILQRGEARALQEVHDAGGSALILPDLPLEQLAPFRKARRSTSMDTVLLASPASSPERLKELTRRTEGFLYLVSKYGTTGVGPGDVPNLAPSSAAVDLRPLVETAHALRTKLPVLVGFGVSSAEDVRRHLAAGADGVVVGSALQHRLSQGDEPSQVRELVAPLLAART